MELFKLLGTVAVETGEANKNIDDTGKKFEGLGGKFEEGLETVGKWSVGFVAAVGAAGAALGKFAVGAADDMQKAMNQFSAATGENVSEYEDVMKSIYKNNFGESFEDIGNAMATVKQQMGDIGTGELEDLTTTALMLRDTFGFEVNESMRAAKMLMDQFGISGTEAFNLIAQGAQNGLDKNGDLLDSINEYSVHYEQLGFTAEGFFASLENGSKAGTFSVDKLGDAMKEFGIRSKDGSDTSRKAFDALGFDADAMFQVFNEGGEIAASMTQELIERLAEMPDGVDKTTAGVALFGTMFEDLGVDGIKALGNIEGSIDNTKNALNQINSVRYDSWGDAMEGLNRTLQTAFIIPLGEKIIPWLSETLPAKLAAIETIAPKVLGVFETAFSGITGAIANVKAVAEPIIQGMFDWVQTTGIPIISGIWQSIQTGFSTISPVLEEAVGRISTLVQTVIGIATEIFGVFMEKIGNIRDRFNEFAEVVKSVVGFYLGNLISQFESLVVVWETYLLPVIKMVVDAFLEIVKSILSRVKPAIQNITDAFTMLYEVAVAAIEEYILPAIAAFIAMILELYEENKDKLDLIGELFEAVTVFIKRIVQGVIDWFNKNLLPFIQLVRDFVQENMDKIKEIFQNAIDFVTGIIKVFIAFFKGDWEGMWEAVKATLQSGVDFINSIFETLKEFLRTILESIKQEVSDKFGGIYDSMVDKITEAKEKLTEIFEDIKEGIGEKLKSIKEAVGGVVENIKELFDFEVNFENLKLPHFSIDPEGWTIGDLLDGVIPELGIDWYAKGGVMENPTAFGVNGGRLMVGGEAGPEAIAPIAVLQDYIAQAVAAQNAGMVMVLERILDAIIAMDENMGGNLREALDGTAFEVNHREFARLVKAVN